MPSPFEKFPDWWKAKTEIRVFPSWTGKILMSDGSTYTYGTRFVEGTSPREFSEHFNKIGFIDCDNVHLYVGQIVNINWTKNKTVRAEFKEEDWWLKSFWTMEEIREKSIRIFQKGIDKPDGL